MKSLALITVLCSVLFFSKASYAQLPDQDFNNAWTITHAHNSLGLSIQNDLSFHIFSFLSSNKVEVYLRFIIDGRYKRTASFTIRDSILTINDLHQQFQYRIIKRTETQIVLNKEENYYYLRRLLSSKDGNLIIADKDAPLSSGKTDTLNLMNDIYPAAYNGDLFDLFAKNIPDDIRKDTAFHIQLSFTLKADGSLNDIQVFPDDYKAVVLNTLMPLMEQNWEPARQAQNKPDANITLLIYVASPAMQSWHVKQPIRLSQKLYKTGLSSLKEKNILVALENFAACEKLFDSYKICDFYSTRKQYDFADMQKIWVNAMMNQASLYLLISQPELACSKWLKASKYDKEAYENYINICVQE